MTDIEGGIEVIEDAGDKGYFELKEICGFSLDSKTKKQEIMELIQKNSSKVLNKDEADCCKVYGFDRDAVEHMRCRAAFDLLGDAFAVFLDRLLQENSETYYMSIG